MSKILRRLGQGLRRVVRPVTPAGRGVIALGLFSLAAAEYAGLEEFRIIATMCGVLVGLAVVLVLVPIRVRADLELRPTHTVAGEGGHGQVRATNLWPLRLNRPLVHVPVDGIGGQPIAFRAPVLRRGRPEDVEFVVPPMRRGVRLLGPAGIRRTDPLGFFSRQTNWTGVQELWVRPEIAYVESLGLGWVRDLEGVPSDTISMSDLSFHALREYVRGDDLRHVHWRSSARTGELHVRQYHDTRRSHVVVIVDDRAGCYGSEDDYELGLSVAASVVTRAALDEFDLTFASGPELLTASAAEILDALCLAERGDTDLVAATGITAARAVDASQVVMIGGTGTPAGDFAAGRAAFSDDVRFLGLRVDPAARPSRPWDQAGLLRVPSLRALPGLLSIQVGGTVT